MDESQFSRLVTLAQSAGLDQRKWAWFLREFQQVSGSARVQLFSHDLRTGQPLGFHQYGYDPVFLDSYVAHFGPINPWIGAFDRLTLGKAALGKEIVSDADLVGSEFYSDWLRPQEDILGSAVAILECKSSRVTAIAANVRRQDREKREPGLRDLIQSLVPHLQHSLKVSDMLGRLSLENRILWSGTDPELAALFVLDTAGRVRYANGRGDMLAERGTLCRVDQSGSLTFIDPLANAEVSRALQDRDLHGQFVPLPFVIKGTSTGQFLCRAMPLSEADGPHPWIGPQNDAGRAFTLLILSPIAPQLDTSRHRTSIN